MSDTFKEVCKKEGESGWSIYVNELDEVFYGCSARVWITTESEQLSLELWAGDNVGENYCSARLAVTPLGPALWESVNEFVRVDTKTHEIGKNVLEPIPFDKRDDLSVLTAYRETLSRAVAYCDAVIDEHKYRKK